MSAGSDMLSSLAGAMDVIAEQEAEILRLKQAKGTEEWEYRNVGEHQWRYQDGKCAVCGAIASNGVVHSPCPSKRERRRVGPWEPVVEGDFTSAASNASEAPSDFTSVGGEPVSDEGEAR